MYHYYKHANTMKICTSIKGLLPNERETGAAVVDREFVRGALALGHEVCVVLPEGREGFVADIPGAAFLISGKSASGLWGRLCRLRIACRQLLRVYRNQPDTVFRVNSFFSSLLEILPLLWVARGQLRLFVQFHHRDDSRLRNAIARWIFSRAQLLICPSEAARMELLDLLGSNVPKVYCVYHGVDEKFFFCRQISRQYLPNRQALPLNLLFVGHLEKRKNPRALLALAKKLHEEGTEFELRIVGNGPEFCGLKKQCDGQPWAQTVSLLGEISDEAKLGEYAKADVFVFPSKQEGFGLVLCEAMAAGLPVLAYNTSAMPEIVSPETGYLVDVDDVSSMAKVIKSLSQDRPRLERISANAVKRAQINFDWSQKMSEIFDLLEFAFAQKK